MFSLKQAPKFLFIGLISVGSVVASDTKVDFSSTKTYHKILHFEGSSNTTLPIFDKLSGTGKFSKSGPLDINGLTDAAFKNAFNFGQLNAIDKELALFERQKTKLSSLKTELAKFGTEGELKDTNEGIDKTVAKATEAIEKLKAFRARYIQVYGRMSILFREQLLTKRNVVAFTGVAALAVAGGYFAHRYGYDVKALNLYNQYLPVVKNSCLAGYEKGKGVVSLVWEWIKNLRSKPANNPVSSITNKEDVMLFNNGYLCNCSCFLPAQMQNVTTATTAASEVVPSLSVNQTEASNVTLGA